MSAFQLYLQVGFQHIADLQAYDHLLFLLALCAAYRPRQWREILILVTAFTIGHSITLALSTLKLILIPSEIIEFLIPVTIFLTAVFNVLKKDDYLSKTRLRLNYSMALFFGLIHGLGFSNYLRSLLGKESSILTPLFAFNIGLELGQILIVAIIFTIAFFLQERLQVKPREWNLFISGAAAGISLILMRDTAFWV